MSGILARFSHDTCELASCHGSSRCEQDELDAQPEKMAEMILLPISSMTTRKDQQQAATSSWRAKKTNLGSAGTTHASRISAETMGVGNEQRLLKILIKSYE